MKTQQNKNPAKEELKIMIQLDPMHPIQYKLPVGGVVNFRKVDFFYVCFVGKKKRKPHSKPNSPLR